MLSQLPTLLGGSNPPRWAGKHVALERILPDPDRQRAELEEVDRRLADFLRRLLEWDGESEEF